MHSLGARYSDWWLSPLPRSRVAWLRTIVYLFIFLDVLVLRPWVADNGMVSEVLYRPLLIGRLLSLPVPTPLIVAVVKYSLLAFAALALSGRLPRVAGLAVFVLYTEWMLIAFSYGKVDHDRFAFLVALAVLPTVGPAHWRDHSADASSGWALRCVQVAVVATYFLAAFAKFRFGGPDWVDGATLTRAVLRRGTFLADPLREHWQILHVGQYSDRAVRAWVSVDALAQRAWPPVCVVCIRFSRRHVCSDHHPFLAPRGVLALFLEARAPGIGPAVAQKATPRSRSRGEQFVTAMVPLPRSMAAIGDSITLGVGAEPEGYGVAPAYSWATGDAVVDGVGSHYERLLASEPAIRGNNHNLARGGARMTHARRQARRAIRLGVEYVTIFLGGNDLCGRRSGEFTPLADFEKHINDALQVLTRGLPQSYVYVLSIPNIYEMWEALRADRHAMQMWAMAGTCRALSSADPAVVRSFRDHNLAYNEILERVCSHFERCRFDDHAVYQHAYKPEYLSLDFFHPSYAGQHQLAEVSWRAGYWGDASS